MPNPNYQYFDSTKSTGPDEFNIKGMSKAELIKYKDYLHQRNEIRRIKEEAQNSTTNEDEKDGSGAGNGQKSGKSK